MTDEELIARLRKADEYKPLGHDGWEAADRIEALVKERDGLLTTWAESRERHLSSEARAERLEAVLRELIDHTHNCEKELTERLYRADFCGESLPLTNARAALKGADHE